MGNISQLLIKAFDHHQNGDTDEAEAIYRAVLNDHPTQPNALHLMGLIEKDRDELDAALKFLTDAVTSQPKFDEAWLELAELHFKTKNPAAARACLDRIDRNALVGEAAARADLIDAALLRQEGHLEDAAAILKTLANDHPEHAGILSALGTTLYALHRYAETADVLSSIDVTQPGADELTMLLGNSLLAIGDTAGALAVFENLYRHDPMNEKAYPAYLFYMIFHPAYAEESLYRENLAWGKRLEELVDLPDYLPSSPRNKTDRLKIGYFAYEFNSHVTSYFLEPVLARHDRSKFEIFGYSATSKTTDTTRHLETLTEHWTDVSDLTPPEIARRIAVDRIDILVTASSYRADHRLPLAYKPAPIQVAYSNLASTTGLTVVDYLVTEELTDPTGVTDDLYTEKLVRLSNRNCYAPPPDAPSVGASPFQDKGFVTFGSFNNIGKITAGTLLCWARILDSVTGARLLIKNVVASPHPKDWDFFIRQITAAGIDLSRVDFMGRTPQRESHLAAYHEVDIGLDPFPCNGGTTTCESFWMGVPIITKYSRTFGTRQGLNYLTKVGLHDLAAESDDEYVAAAVTLAQDQDRLRSIRRTLRQKMQETILDYDQHVDELEAAYNIMWTRYVTGTETTSFSVTRPEED